MRTLSEYDTEKTKDVRYKYECAEKEHVAQIQQPIG